MNDLKAMQTLDPFETAIRDLDRGLFAKIASQSTDNDKRSLLACQLAVREFRSSYRYLEIGSYLGGSIQPHLLDPRCRQIYSIDKRPPVQPDERGIDFVYADNSTARMLENLREVSADVEKITTIDGDCRSLDPQAVDQKVDLCFIDGEHTDAAVIADFQFCLQVLDPDGAIVFHDAQITYNGIASCVKQLQEAECPFRAYILPDIVFVIELRNSPIHRHPAIAESLVNNHQAYLFSLQNNDEFRRFANRFPFRQLRNLRARLRGGNISR
ncbi:MAG TPA: class I SAM-dependent methyltransferase [Pyrinomonadaceae bacterium]|jgi:hypothetical protein|nr:class I SAM-dependent methyltransferase [Pyrinomonadaceae bacterium]